MASPDDIKERLDISPAPVVVLRAYGAHRGLGHTEEPIVLRVEAPRAVGDHSTFTVKPRQGRY